jgi:hypothetical protein
VIAISAIHPEFGGSMSFDLLRKEMAKEPLPELEDLIETFQTTPAYYLYTQNP